MNRFYIFCLLAVVIVLAGDIGVTRRAHQEYRRELGRMEAAYFRMTTNALDAQEMARRALAGWVSANQERDEYREALRSCFEAHQDPRVPRASNQGFTIRYVTNGAAQYFTNQP